MQASSALAHALQKAVVTDCNVSAGASMFLTWCGFYASFPTPHPLLFLLYVLPALFETNQQLKGTGQMSAMLCSPVSLQVVQ